MTELLSLFLNNLLPVFLAAGAGYLLSRITNLDPRPLSQVIFYIFSPCLVFIMLTQNELSDGDIFTILIFTISVVAVLGLLTWGAGLILKLERRTLAAVLLTTMFMNVGNYGLPLILFSFGETALSYASLVFIAAILLTYTLGVIIASMGSTSFRSAFINLLKIPSLYALVLSLVIVRTQWQIPLPIQRTASLISNATIPAMLVLLGMQFRNVNWSGKTAPTVLAVTMRLLISPAVALLLGSAIGIVGAARQASVTEAAMPTAVMTTVLATEYNTEPSFVTKIVLITTVLSPLTLTPLLAYLGA